MLSKEEIEKTKEFMKFYKNDCLNREINNIENYETVNDEEFIYKNIETLLQYIDQLEQENIKLNKMIDEMAKYIKEPYLINICKGRMQKITAIKQYFEKEVEKQQ